MKCELGVDDLIDSKYRAQAFMPISLTSVASRERPRGLEVDISTIGRWKSSYSQWAARGLCKTENECSLISTDDEGSDDTNTVLKHKRNDPT